MSDLIDRQTAIDVIMGQPPEPHYPSWYAAQIEKLPAVQPDHVADVSKKVSISCAHENNDVIFRKMAIEALARMMPRSYTPDGSHPADEEIFRAQEVFADCIEALEILPSEQPETHWIPCSERMPERADNVIICYKAGDYTLVSTGIYLHKFKMWYVDVVGDLRDGVAAWMPLPEPYWGGDAE